MGPNAFISWQNVTQQPFIPQTAADVGALATSSPKLTYIGPNGIYTGVLSANQINAGQIAAQYINTANLAPEKIYQVGSPNNFAVMGGTYGDMALYYNNAEYFRIYNAQTSAYFQYKNNFFMNFDNNFVYARNSWDFSNATISQNSISTSAINGLEERLKYLEDRAFILSYRGGGGITFNSKNVAGVDIVPDAS
jgi:hypothetical protein